MGTIASTLNSSTSDSGFGVKGDVPSLLFPRGVRASWLARVTVCITLGFTALFVGAMKGLSRGGGRAFLTAGGASGCLLPEAFDGIVLDVCFEVARALSRSLGRFCGSFFLLSKRLSFAAI